MFIIGRPRIPENLQWCSSAELRIVQGSGFRILVNVVPHPDELWLVFRLSQLRCLYPTLVKAIPSIQSCHAADARVLAADAALSRVLTAA